MTTPDELRERYRSLFSTPAGQVVLADLLARSNVFATTFNAENSHDTAYREGQRSVGLFLYNILAEQPDVRPKPEVAKE